MAELETNKERLERIGRTQLMTNYSMRGKVEIQSVLYPTQEFYEQGMYKITGVVAKDPKGLGYDFPETDSEV